MASVNQPQLPKLENIAASHADESLNGNRSDGKINGTSHSSSTPGQIHRFDPSFTQKVIDATGPKASPRARKVMASMIRHIHDFARENEITVDEWMAGVEMVVHSFYVC